MGKTISLEEIATRIADSILDSAIITKTTIIDKVKTNLYVWHRLTNRPLDYDAIKTDKGKLVATLEKRDVERDFWKYKVMSLNGGEQEQMQPLYDELNTRLKDLGFDQ